MLTLNNLKEFDYYTSMINSINLDSDKLQIEKKKLRDISEFQSEELFIKYIEHNYMI